MQTSLLDASRDSIIWIRAVITRLTQVAPARTWIVILYAVIARITRILTFLLPLKVILLAGSAGVPRYFRFFVSPEYRMEAIVGLATAAIASYAITLVIESRLKRLTEKGGNDLLAASDVMPVIPNQREQMQGFYARFTGIVAIMAFATAGLVGLLFLDRILAGYLLVLIICFYLFTVWALFGITSLNRTALSELIVERLGTYLSVLSAVCFLSSFLIILYPFVVGTNGHILVAIISVVLLRHMLAAITSAIKDIVSLSKQRMLIDTLIFPEHRLKVVEGKNQRTLRDLFGRLERKETVAKQLSEIAGDDASIGIRWRDTILRGAAEFTITLTRKNKPKQHLRLFTLPRRHARLIENENLLFSYIERDLIKAPPLVKHFSRADHECLIYEAGTGQAVKRRDWTKVQTGLMVDLWSVEPPSPLIKTYSSSHTFLHERLSEEFTMRAEMAVDDEKSFQQLERFIALLPTLRRRIGALPLCLVNHRLLPQQVVRRPDGGVYAFGWGEWSLEPAGAKLGNLFAKEGELKALLARVQERRQAMCTPAVNVANLELARASDILERKILRGNMKAALTIMIGITNELEGRGRRRTIMDEDMEYEEDFEYKEEMLP